MRLDHLGRQDVRGASATPAARLAEVVAGELGAAGSDMMFGLPGGGNNLELVGAAESAGLRFILTHTETAAAIMAAIYGELRQCPAACIVTRGPGAASAVNGVAQAFLDRQPLLIITDAVSSADRARISHQRIDQSAMLAPVTKWSSVLGSADPASVMQRALALSRQPRPGPVHLDFDPAAGHPAAGDAAARDGAGPLPDPAGELPDRAGESPAAVRSQRADPADLQRALAGKQRPAVLLGLGALAAVPELQSLLRGTNIPVLMTYRAKGIVPDSWPNCAGLLTGATAEAPVLKAADVIVTIGVDTVELIPNPWPYAAPVLSLAAWPEDSPYFGQVCEYVADLPAALAAIRPHLTDGWEPGFGGRVRADGLARLLAAKGGGPGLGVAPQQVIGEARRNLPAGTIATVDAGAHMLVAMPLWDTDGPHQALISSGLATMGYALPAAIAAALARPGRRVICFVGDGGLGMGLGELETLARLQLPVTVVVFNDSTLSLIALKQLPAGHGGRAAVGYRDTSFAGIAHSMGVPAETVSEGAAFARAIERSASSSQPFLLDVRIDTSAYPEILDSIRGTR